MEGRENLHVVKYKAITNNCNYDASCTLTSLPVWDLENFKRLVFVVQSVLSYFKALLPRICLEGLRQTVHIFRQDGRSVGRDPNPGLPECETGLPTTRSR
jgi:hypothetical protein